MKASEIINQLCTRLPVLTDKFTNTFGLVSLTRSGTVMTAVCADKHGLEVDNAVAITDADTPITIASLTRAGVIGTLVTATNHDLTNGIAATITISGADDAEFNGAFALINVDSRKTIKFTMEDTGPTTTSNGILRNAESFVRDYNATYKVESVPSENVFTFNHLVAGLPDPLGSIQARTTPRISSGIEIGVLIKAYTEQNINEYWAFVILGDVDASQSRANESDAVSNLQRGNEYRQQIISPFSLFVFIPVEEELAARESRDEVQDLLRPILRSLLFSKLSSQLYADKLNSVQFVGHGVHSYSGSVYVHEFKFQQVDDIYFEDTVGHDDDVAFRDIDFKLFPDVGTQISFMQGTPDLDDIPE